MKRELDKMGAQKQGSGGRSNSYLVITKSQVLFLALYALLLHLTL